MSRRTIALIVGAWLLGSVGVGWYRYERGYAAGRAQGEADALRDEAESDFQVAMERASARAAALPRRYPRTVDGMRREIERCERDVERAQATRPAPVFDDLNF